jgi:hypothetical protein
MLRIERLLKRGIRVQPWQQPRTLHLCHGARRAKLRGWRFILFNAVLGLGHIVVSSNLGSYAALVPDAAGDLAGVSPSFAIWAATDFLIALVLGFPIVRWPAGRFGDYRLFTAGFVVFALASFCARYRRSTAERSQLACFPICLPPLARLEPYGMLILIGLLFIMPILGAQMGVDLSIVSRGAGVVTEIIISAIVWINWQLIIWRSRSCASRTKSHLTPFALVRGR